MRDRMRLAAVRATGSSTSMGRPARAACTHRAGRRSLGAQITTAWARPIADSMRATAAPDTANGDRRRIRIPDGHQAHVRFGRRDAQHIGHGRVTAAQQRDINRHADSGASSVRGGSGW
jgi:hypothetical protein